MAKEVIAIDLGGTNLRVALVKNNKIVKYVKKKTPKDGKQLLDELCKSISSLMSKKVKGIGAGVPGPVINGIIKNPPNIKVKNFDFKSYLRNKFKVRVEVENDANCVALAEAVYGYKKKDFLVITLGTGVGGGVVLNGQLYCGEGYAGEIGHIILDKGKYFEDYWKKHRKNSLVKDMVKSRDKKDRANLNKLTDYVAQAIASMINVFDPELIVLAGGAREAGNKFLNLIKKKSKKYIFLPKRYGIKWTKLKYPGILGASLLVNKK